MYNIYNDDMLNVIKGIEKESIDLIVTDPPYKTTKRGSSGGTGGMLKTQNMKDGKVFNHNDIEFKEWLPELYRVLKDKGHAYIMSNNKNLINMYKCMEETGFNIFKILIWKKNNVITNMYYMDNHEYIIFARKGKSKKINYNGTKSVLEYDNPKPKTHPTEKPVDLLEILIKNSSEEGDLVLDPFMGTGSCGIACLNNKRNFIGIELDGNYYDIAKNKMVNINSQESLDI